MVKILQIDSCLGILSTGKITESIGLLAKKRGWEYYVAHGGRYVGKSQMRSIQITSKWGEYAHYAKSLIFDAHGLGSTAATIKFVEKIKEINPDIIHLHCIHGYYLNYKILFEYLRTAKTPVVWTFHDCWAMTGHCAHFDAAGCERWKTGCYECPLKSDYPRSICKDSSKENYKLKKELFTSLDNITIVTVSEWLTYIVRQSFMSKYPIELINNGIDIETFKPCRNDLKQKYGIENKFVMIAVASQWSEKKGLYDYIELSKRLSDEYQLIFVGVDNCYKKDIPSNIITIRRTDSQKELAKLYSAADIVLNLSYEETFGLTTVEGFACGTPGIVYNRTASPELITEETGIVVEKGNYKQLINAIETIKKNGKQHYSAACRERAVNFYNKDDKFNEYIELYNSLIMGNNRL